MVAVPLGGVGGGGEVDGDEVDVPAAPPVGALSAPGGGVRLALIAGRAGERTTHEVRAGVASALPLGLIARISTVCGPDTSDR